MKNESTIFNILYVSSMPKSLIEDDLVFFDFFTLNKEKLFASTVEELEEIMKVSFESNNFLKRLIPQKAPGNEDKILSETKPQAKGIDGIVTDLYLRRGKHSTTMDLHGLGVVAWAIQHNIPVGLITRDYTTHPNYPFLPFQNYGGPGYDFFWLESVIDTLQTDPRYTLGEIPIGDARKVTCKLRELLLK